MRETTNLCDTSHTCHAIHDLSAHKMSTFLRRVSSEHSKLSFFLDCMAPKTAGRKTWGKSGNGTRGTGAFHQTETQASCTHTLLSNAHFLCVAYRYHAYVGSRSECHEKGLLRCACRVSPSRPLHSLMNQISENTLNEELNTLL